MPCRRAPVDPAGRTNGHHPDFAQLRSAGAFQRTQSDTKIGRPASSAHAFRQQHSGVRHLALRGRQRVPLITL